MYDIICFDIDFDIECILDNKPQVRRKTIGGASALQEVDICLEVYRDEDIYMKLSLSTCIVTPMYLFRYIYGSMGHLFRTHTQTETHLYIYIYIFNMTWFLSS